MTKLPLSGVELIKQFEGCYLSAYPDPLTGNKPITIGWGCTRKLDGGEWKLGDRITQQQADELLLHQLENNYLPQLQKIPCWGELNINQQGALLSFGYNLGATFYGSPNFNSITTMLKTKNWALAKEVFVKYRNPGSSVEQGLKRRRLAEADLFIKPI
ncbi:lysozyme [Nostoc sp. CENA67]|uniref:Lysozyme n=1 Tax=Amazonocrinis nigriterrae CENA67 TaxID=2794033 RepID=A0A8J7HYV5_9NOST|nr:lysozyme [Amazonocrinis nigriterrae]MBH8566745.1 lysozyme [Amazonocrinis nigriterrae CENA67]